MKKQLFLSLLLIVTLIITGCGATNSTQAPLTKERDLKPAEPFTLKDLAGKDVALADFKGKPVYMKFWASWCSVCLSEMEELDTLSSQKNPFEVITIVSPGYHGEQSEADFKEWYSSLGYSQIKVLLDPDGTVAKAYDVRAYPTSVFINGEGALMKTQIGQMSSTDVKAAFEAESKRTDMEEELPKQDIVFDSKEPNLKDIYLAGGCFWGIEAYMERIKGVKDAISGYANGKTLNPSYEDVSHKQTGHAETVHVVYDASIIDLNKLLKYYFKVIDPTSVNRQGNDVGTQYRTGIYYTNEDDKVIINALMKEKQKQFKKPLQVEVKPIVNFGIAEDYHQDYLKKNPNGYCHIDLNEADVPIEDSGK